MPPDLYEVTFVIRCGRRVSERARKAEAEEVGRRVIAHLADMGTPLEGEATIRVRRMTPP